MAMASNFCFKIAQELDTRLEKLCSWIPSHLFNIDLNFRYVSSPLNSGFITTLEAFHRSVVHSRDVLLSEELAGGSRLLLPLFADTGAPPHFVETAIDDILWFAWEAEADPFNLERKVIKLCVEVVVEVIDDSLSSTSSLNFKAATKSSIQALKRVKLGDDQNRFLPFKKRRRVDSTSRKQCTICLDEFLDREEVVLMPCGHVYHDVCIVKWLETSHCCPLCRYQMPS